VQTVRHFFPDFNVWLDRLPDTRVQDACTYDRRFLAWWGLHLYLLQLGSRRQLDFELRDGGPQVLTNLNRLAGTTQTTLPVHDTLDHFIGHVQQRGWEKLRDRCVQRLLRMKALDAARLLGQPVLLLDATGLLCFHQRHCAYCLTQRHGKQTLYLHQVLEAKLLGPGGLVVSLGSEFIENADAAHAKERSKNNFPISLRHRGHPVVELGQYIVKENSHGAFESFCYFASLFVNLVENVHRHRQARTCLRLGNVMPHLLDGFEDDPLARAGYVRKQTVFDGIVFGSIRRIVGNTNFQTHAASKRLQILLEQVLRGAVAAAAIAEQQ
jgi:hypothetical protein